MDPQSEIERLRLEAEVLITATAEALEEAIRRLRCHHCYDEMLIVVHECQRQAARVQGPGRKTEAIDMRRTA